MIRDIEALDFINNESSFNKKMKSVKLTYEDNFIFTQNKKIKQIEENLKVLKKYQNCLFSLIFEKNQTNNIYTNGISINVRLPLALCGYASVGVEEKGIRRVVYCILNVIPSENSTSIVIVGLKEDIAILEPYWKYYTQNNISILNMIESFMIHGTDHWFITPSVWNRVSLEKQKIILNDILATNKSFLEQFDLSIFDDIRHDFIKQLEIQQKLCFQKSIEDLIIHEKKKFSVENYKPTRSAEEGLIEVINRK
ncbi:hypothetical protein [Clostridium sp. BSD9I1]|uniref:hypothetical protein n=1 Tax=Clostridium sp. BSD9I1 TaxID=2003589 RepID=UPI0016472395|nr:hypothetical protein [Clostridium sp. BSD9I1]